MFDGSHEMLNRVAYQDWAAKPRNGGFDRDTSGSRWDAMCTAPGAITDEGGPTKKLKDRVAVRVKDLVIHRNAHERTKVVNVAEREKKKSIQTDIGQVEKRLQTDGSWKGSCALSVEDQAKAMADARAASLAMGESMNAFSSAGLQSLQVGQVRELAPPKKEGPADDGKDNDGAKAGAGAKDTEAESQKKSTTPNKPAPKKKVQVWFERDEKIMTELQTFRKWSVEVKAELGVARSRCQAVRNSIPEALAEVVKDESNLLNNRLRAIKLILNDDSNALADKDTSVETGSSPLQDSMVGREPHPSRMQGSGSGVADGVWSWAVGGARLASAVLSQKF